MSQFRPRLSNDTNWQQLIDLAREVSPETLLKIYQASSKPELEDSPQLVLTGDKAKDLQQLLDKYNIDKDLWNIDKARISDWITWFKSGDQIESRVNYQLRAEISRRVVKLRPIDEILNEYLDKLANKFPKRQYVAQPSDKQPIVVVLADAHIGALHENKVTEQHSIDSVIRKLQEISEIVNSYEAPVHLVFLGDLIESFTGMNKPDSWKYTMMHGVDVALKAYDILGDFIHSLNHFEQLYLISGNHDRITSSNQEDADGQVVKLIHGMFQRLNPTIKSIYDPYILSVDIDNVQYILTHGNHKITKMKPEEMVFVHGKQERFNVLLSAHLHNRTVSNDTYKFRSYIVPSICSGSAFSERSGWYSNSGFLIFKSKGNAVNCFDYNLEP